MMNGHNFIVVYKYRTFFEIILLMYVTLNNSTNQYYSIQLNIDNESKFQNSVSIRINYILICI